MKIAFNPSDRPALTQVNDYKKDIIFDLTGHNIFARGVKFYGTDTNTWRPIVDNLTSNSAVWSLSANQGRILNLTKTPYNNTTTASETPSSSNIVICPTNTSYYSSLGIPDGGGGLLIRGNTGTAFDLWLHDTSNVWYKRTSTGAWKKMDAGNADYASNADTLDGYHANGLFTNLGSSGGAILSVTIGGTTKSLGQFQREGSSQIWINGRLGALLRETTASGYHSIWSMKTSSGSWEFGEYNTSGYQNIPLLTYITDANYNNKVNSYTYQIKFPLASGTVALTSNIPTTLKNPFSLTTFGVVYDGSAAKVVTPVNFVSQLDEGTSTITDGTMLITSYASNNGFADTNAVNTPYKRKAIHLWEYIHSKVNAETKLIRFKNIDGKEVSYNGSSELDLRTGTYIAKLPYGFASWTSNVTWGNTTGTSFASWNDSSGGSIDFRKDNPSSGKMSIKVNGRVYVNEGYNPVLSSEYNNGFWGIRTPDGGNDWIRTSNNGLIPYVSGGAGSGHSSLGTSSWYFSTAYIDNIYGNLVGSVDGYRILSDSKLLYKTEYTVDSPSDTWILIKLPAWNSSNEIVYIDGWGNNRSAHCVVYCGSRNRDIWGYQSDYNGVVVNKINWVEADNGKFAVVAHIDSGITTLRVRGTTNLEIVKTTANSNAFSIGSNFFSSGTMMASADKVDGWHVIGGSKPFGGLSPIGADGVMEVGRYLDFHYDNTTGSDYSTRLQATNNYSNVVNLPSASGTLALTSQIPTKASWNYDDRYVLKTGDAMSGQLTIGTGSFGALVIQRNDDSNGASIQFKGKSSIYGYIGFNNNAKDKQLQRWNVATNQVYTVLDTSSTYLSGSTVTINGSSITVAKSDHTHDGRYVRYYAVTSLDCNSLANGFTAAKATASNSANNNHSAFLYVTDVGTPFQLQFPDSSNFYIYKRYKSGSSWSAWSKLSAGYADSAAQLTTARKINGTAFNGTVDITTAYWGTTRNITIGNTTKEVNGSGNVSWSLSEIGLGAYLPLAGGTMTNTAYITWADSGSWGAGTGAKGAIGGLKWSGQSDYAWLYAEETTGDNLDLVMRFGDDNSNGLSIRNASNTQTTYISASGTIRTIHLDTQTAFFHPGNDSTLKLYSGKTEDGKSDGHIALQTSIDGTDGQTHVYPTQYGSRCVLALQPRGGSVYIGSLPNGGGSHKLNVNGSCYATSYSVNSMSSLYQANDCSPKVGDKLGNLVIQTWYGVSFTSNCCGTYKGTTAVGIDAREGVIRAANYEGKWQGYVNNLSTNNTTDTWVPVLNGSTLYHRVIPTAYNNDPSTLNVNTARYLYTKKFGHGPDSNSWHKIMTFTTNWVGQVTFMYAPEECQRNYWFIANINVRNNNLLFYIVSCTGVYPTMKCIGDNNSWELWIKGSTQSYDPYGAMSLLSMSNASVSAYGYIMASQSSEPSSTYNAYPTNAFRANSAASADTATKLTNSRKIWGQSFNGTADVNNTLRITQTTSNYCEGIRIQTTDSSWATIILGATGDTGTNANAWSIHRKNDNNFAISRNSSDGKNGLVMTSTGMGLGTTSPGYRLDVSGSARITSQLFMPINGNYQAILMGDGCWLGDCNIGNVIGLSGTTNANAGGIKFGKGGMYIGYNGSNHYASSTSVWSSFNADMVDGYHANQLAKAWSASSTTMNQVAQYNGNYFGMITGTGSSGFPNSDGNWTHVFQASYNNNSGGDGSSGNFWITQIANRAGTTSPWIRSRSGGNDITTGWTNWVRIMTKNDIDGYYWANVKISTSSNTQTQPSVNTIYANNWFRSQGSTGWYSQTYGGGIYMSDSTWIRTWGGKAFYCDNQIYSSSSIRMSDIYLQNNNEINSRSDSIKLHLNYSTKSNVTLCVGGGAVTIGESGDVGTNKFYVNGSEYIKGASNVLNHVYADGFRHRQCNNNDYILLAGGGYRKFAGDSTHCVYLGVLTLSRGSGSVSGYMRACDGNSYYYTYTRQNVTSAYCKITFSGIRVVAAMAQVQHSGGGMSVWTGEHRGNGAWWLHCMVVSTTEVRVKGFCNSNTNNDSWWGGNPLGTDSGDADYINVILFGYIP